MNHYSPISQTCPEAFDSSAQHMRILCRLANLAMALAETAADAAQSATTDDEPAPALKTLLKMPMDSAPQPATERLRTLTRTGQILAFTCLSDVVIQAISLHAKLEAAPEPTAQRPPPEPELAPSARRGLVGPALMQLVDQHPDLEISQHDAYQALEARLCAHEHECDTCSTLLAVVAAELGIPPETQPSLVTLNLFACFEEDDPPDPFD